MLRTFQVSATRFWNSLPNEIKSSSNLDILKKSYISIFLSPIKMFITLLWLRLFYFILIYFILILRTFIF